jgi:hypothetical protein
VRVRRYKAVRAGVLADGAELRLVDRIAQFAGAARSTEHRRHGIQNALLRQSGPADKPQNPPPPSRAR